MRDTALSERKDGGIDELLTRLKRLLFGSPGHKSPCLFLAGDESNNCRRFLSQL
ncbi:hypothetical protein ACN5OL_004032 [Cronobacter sakazakii]|nr:hypothetical protein [Cronobacter sakazakii]MDI7263550.1 hypothetical protein [Cronobacter sakazakii]MDI7431421.1 hypothetical protein [Cronobacter sakazakii]MDI7461433.1 hypothetical protein [Cronobacter sakazakii]MDI7485440.1 hypothetical protein [Cronobacter sakazakii]MDI7628066.1 hypothetical protein [Cronobacter sakazakii]